MEFSYIENQPSTYLVKHLKGKLPTLAKINSLVSEVMNARRECRDAWWSHIPDVGLKNKRVLISKGWAAPAKPSAFGAILVVTADYEAPIESVKFNGKTRGQCP